VFFTLCFATKCYVILASKLFPPVAAKFHDEASGPAAILMFFVSLDILPSAMLLFMHRRLPPSINQSFNAKVPLLMKSTSEFLKNTKFKSSTSAILAGKDPVSGKPLDYLTDSPPMFS
jgi:hypothetical protein